MNDDVERPPESVAPLAGIRVLEIGAFMAAPFGTMQLADLGAGVIKWRIRTVEIRSDRSAHTLPDRVPRSPASTAISARSR
jgi:crotonobetainyl-CoA:carnitine CoA-transferase CaiB-like acyl-CoA transferase